MFARRGALNMQVRVILVVAVLGCLKICSASEATGTVGDKNGTETQVAPAVSTLAPIPTTTRRPLLQGIKSPCSCNEGQCGCCTGVILERLKQKACMNFTYDPDDFAITAAVSMNERVLYKNTVSGKNPPPMCVRVPRFRFIRFCVEFSNIYFAQRNIHMCIDAEAEWEEFTLVEWSFDCIRMGAGGVAVIRPEDGGGVATSSIDEEDQVDEDYDDSARNAPIPNKNSTKYVAVVKGKKVKVKTLKNGDVSILFDNNV